MESQITSEDSTHEQQSSTQKNGGLNTIPFIIANEAFEKTASYGLLPNMIMYLMNGYHMSVSMGTNVISIWSAFTNFLPIVGAFLSDSYLGRYRTIAFGSVLSFMGAVLLWLTTMIPDAKPTPCSSSNQSCKLAGSNQLALLLFSFGLMSIGAGGIRSCSLAFGADQWDVKDNSRNETILQNYFNWYYASTAFAVLISMTVVVYIQDHFGWKVGFGVPALLMLLSALLFFLASPFYNKVNGNKNLFTRLAQAAIVSFKNRHLILPQAGDIGVAYHHEKSSRIVAPTEKLRFINKACIIRSVEKDLGPDGKASNPWSLCTIEQVEELKALLKVIPIWSTGIMIAVTVNQPTFPLIQANSMDRHITPHFQIPGGSFATFTVGTLTIWVAIYDRLILPQLAKLTGKPYGLSLKQRMGIGLALSCTSMAVSATIEGIRRRSAIAQGFADNPHAVLHMSAMWLVPQHCLNGLAEAFFAIGQSEFSYSQFPKSMSSIATSLFGLGMAVANLLVGAIVGIVDDLSKRGGQESWVSSNLNKGHYDYYYWLLAGLSVLNFIYFLVCCWAYGPCEEGKIMVKDEELRGSEEAELVPNLRELRLISPA
ncbi:hypothetical protein Sjap_019991 [Stephania japonica]|uniref:Uncharacterized protein n=1 Tax=Stephania japonica TaxID=461633 RepID=A0AAP0F5D7_9MAGN